MAAALRFPGGEVIALQKDPAELLLSARAWIDLAAQDILAASLAAKRGDKADAVKLLRAAEHKSSMGRSDMREALAVEAGPS
jgi:hypothetical protein